MIWISLYINFFWTALQSLYKIKFIHFKVCNLRSFCKCIQLCNHHHNKKEYSHHPQKVPWCLFVGKPLLPPQAPDNLIWFLSLQFCLFQNSVWTEPYSMQPSMSTSFHSAWWCGDSHMLLHGSRLCPFSLLCSIPFLPITFRSSLEALREALG